MNINVARTWVRKAYLLRRRYALDHAVFLKRITPSPGMGKAGAVETVAEWGEMGYEKASKNINYNCGILEVRHL